MLNGSSRQRFSSKPFVYTLYLSDLSVQYAHTKSWCSCYGDPVGPLATISRQPGQARKGAATAVTLCAGVWLAVVAT